MNILVIRFSALGDVAMLTPVIKEVLQTYPDVNITMVSKKFHEPLFNNIERLQFYGVNLNDYKGVYGMAKLAKEINALGSYDAIIDAHNVLRTKSLKLFLPTGGKKIATIGKGRTAKKKLTRKNNKELKPLKLTIERYADCFKAIGLEEFELHNVLEPNPQPMNEKLISHFGYKKSNWIGIAPFAAHKAKRMPFEKAENVIAKLTELPNVKIMLFGGGEQERKKLKSISSMYDNVYNVVGKIKFEDELKLISHLDVMVSMDSANMHFASLMGIPVVSVWGGTHPYAGFMGYGQSITDAVQSELECRPCSVYGSKPCHRKDYACLSSIQEEDILIKVSKYLTTTDETI